MWPQPRRLSQRRRRWWRWVAACWAWWGWGWGGGRCGLGGRRRPGASACCALRPTGSAPPPPLCAAAWPQVYSPYGGLSACALRPLRRHGGGPARGSQPLHAPPHRRASRAGAAGACPHGASLFHSQLLRMCSNRCFIMLCNPTTQMKNTKEGRMWKVVQRKETAAGSCQQHLRSTAGRTSAAQPWRRNGARQRQPPRCASAGAGWRASAWLPAVSGASSNLAQHARTTPGYQGTTRSSK